MIGVVIAAHPQLLFVLLVFFSVAVAVDITGGDPRLLLILLLLLLLLQPRY